MKTLLRLSIIACMVLLALIICAPRRTLAGILQAAYQIVENAGTPLVLRNKLNFTGSGVTCADNAGTATTDCTITAGTGGGTPGSTLFSSTSSTGPNDTAVETTLIGTVTGSTTIAANTFTDGAILEARGQGFFSLPAVSDSLTVKAKCGSTVLGSATFTPAAGVVTNGTFRFWLMITGRGSGAGGAFMTNGLIELTGSTLSPAVSEVLNTSTVAFNFTTACVFDMTAQWGAGQVGESITGTNVAAWIPGAPVTSVNGLTGAVVLPNLTAPISADWTAFNTGSMVQVPTFGSGRFTMISRTGADNVQGVAHALPTPPYTATFRVWPIVSFNAGTPGAQLPSVQVGWADGAVGTPGKIATGGAVWVSPGLALGGDNWASTTAHNANWTLATLFSTYAFVPPAAPVWIRLTDNSTNWLVDVSFDGSNYLNLFTETRNTYLTATQLVMTVNPRSATVGVGAVFDSFTTGVP